MTVRFLAISIVFALEAAAFAAPSAEQLFEQGGVAYNAGNYQGAVAKWRESYAISKAPELFFNIGLALELDGKCEDALAMFRRFIRLAPNSADRPRAREFVRELKAKCEVATAAPRETTSVDDATDESSANRDASDPANETRSAGLRIAGLTVAGAGIAAVATGLYFGHRAASLRDEVASACPGAGCDWSVLASKDAEGRRAETKQYIFVGIGATAIVGGGLMYLLGRSREQQPAPIAISSGRNGAVITWSGSW
jgi:tetratricopeptide (TPR) repeat protein